MMKCYQRTNILEHLFFVLIHLEMKNVLRIFRFGMLTLFHLVQEDYASWTAGA